MIASEDSETKERFRMEKVTEENLDWAVAHSPGSQRKKRGALNPG